MPDFSPKGVGSNRISSNDATTEGAKLTDTVVDEVLIALQHASAQVSLSLSLLRLSRYLATVDVWWLVLLVLKGDGSSIRSDILIVEFVKVQE